MIKPPDPVLEAVAAFITERPEWAGTATGLAVVLGLDMKANALAMRLNIRRYESARTHAGRTVTLSLVPPQA